MELMDAYYSQCQQQFETWDLQLTAVTCFFIASKNVLIEPMTMQNAVETLCYNKFSYP